jgi:NAD(P)-dependent dehydrogenase (short-subunit alcohol dehydrogenase family)
VLENDLSQAIDRGELWVPFATQEWMLGRGNRAIAGAIGRLKPGVTLAQAHADLAAVSARLEKHHPQDNLGWAAEAIPLRRLGQPEEVAQAIVFFAGPGAGYVTGQVLSVSGGLTMHG